MLRTTPHLMIRLAAITFLIGQSQSAMGFELLNQLLGLTHETSCEQCCLTPNHCCQTPNRCAEFGCTCDANTPTLQIVPESDSSLELIVPPTVNQTDDMPKPPIDFAALELKPKPAAVKMFMKIFQVATEKGVENATVRAINSNAEANEK